MSLVFVADQYQTNKFMMTCYRTGNQSMGTIDLSSEGLPLTFPAPVVRGEQMSCYISVQSWDTKVRLITENCHFFSTDSNDIGPSFTFIKNK